ncbi:MAG: restriction endonuclease subunit S [Sulfuritalea sp.]|nr:restriction endonuclease subunit S [Sulfuritalea sp.]
MSREQPTVLGDYFTLQRGTTYESKLLDQPGPVLLGLGTIQRNGGFRSDSLRTYGGASPEKLLVRPGELYVSLKDVTQSADLLGAVARLPRDHAPGRLTQDTVKLEPKGANVPIDYLHWVMRTPEYRSYCKGRATGTTNLGLSREDFLSFPANEPSDAQSLLVATLDSLDDKIELNRRMNETLEAMARAIFKSWFVDFDPVRAKASGESPESICRRLGLTPDALALFPDSFQDSELGEIPVGWSAGTLGDIADHPKQGIRPDEMTSDTPYIALEHMPRRCIALSEWGYAEGLESNKFKFKKGEVLFGKLRPYFHKVGVAPLDGVCSTDIVVITPKTDSWFGIVLGHVSSDVFVEYTNAGSTGTKMPRTSWKEMAAYPLAIPPVPLASAFADSIRPSVGRITSGIFESRTLAALRDTLLPKLLSSELTCRRQERNRECA